MRIIDADNAKDQIDDMFCVEDMAAIPAGLAKAVFKMALSLEAITPTIDRYGWISVDDRLPCNSALVLAMTIDEDDYQCPVIAQYTKKRGWSSTDCCLDYSLKITHWMPLPDYPE